MSDLVLLIDSSLLRYHIFPSVMIAKSANYFLLFPLYCVKILNRNAAMLSNFVLSKEKNRKKIQLTYLTIITLAIESV